MKATPIEDVAAGRRQDRGHVIAGSSPKLTHGAQAPQRAMPAHSLQLDPQVAAGHLLRLLDAENSENCGRHILQCPTLGKAHFPFVI